MHYALPILVVALVIPAFFALGQGGFASFGRWQRVLGVLLALMLLGAAMEHFLHPDIFAAIIPPALPFRPTLAIVSGIALLAKSPSVFVAGGATIVILAVANMHANTVSSVTGKPTTEVGE